jgi:5-methylcytosine-specific restriction endonuclease McrA
VEAYQVVWNWAAVRTFVMLRDRNTCQLCGTTDPPLPEEKEHQLWDGGPTTRTRYRFDPWDVDHIIPVADGGTDDPENLRLLCIPCHRSVTRAVPEKSDG